MLQKHMESLCGMVVLGGALLLAGRGMRPAEASPPAGSPLKQSAADMATPSLAHPPGDEGTCVRGGKTLATRSPTACQSAGGSWEETTSGARTGAYGGRTPPGGPAAGTSQGSAGGGE